MMNRARAVLVVGLVGIAAYLFARDLAAAMRPPGAGDTWEPDSGYWPEFADANGEGDAAGAGGIVDGYIYPSLYQAENAIASFFGARSLMEVSRAGVMEISRHEALRLDPYVDQAGYPTIGYGHKILPGEDGGPITAARASELLSKDVGSAAAAVNSLVKVPLEQSQFDALVSLVYNIGAGAFRGSTMLRLLNAGDYEGARDQFGVWNKIRQNGVLVESRGLAKRRASEAGLFGGIA